MKKQFFIFILLALISRNLASNDAIMSSQTENSIICGILAGISSNIVSNSAKKYYNDSNFLTVSSGILTSILALSILADEKTDFKISFLSCLLASSILEAINEESKNILSKKENENLAKKKNINNNALNLGFRDYEIYFINGIIDKKAE